MATLHSTPDGNCWHEKVIEQVSKQTLKRHGLSDDAEFRYSEYARPGRDGRAVIVDGDKVRTDIEFDLHRHRFVRTGFPA